MPAPPYQAQPSQNGLFELKPNTDSGAPAPSDAEIALAGAINRCINWVRDNPIYSKKFLPDYVNVLKDIASLGLVAPEARDLSKATKEFIEKYGPLDPNDSRPANSSTSRAAQGPFQVKLRTDGEIHIAETPGGAKPSDDQLKFASELDRQERLVREVFKRGELDVKRREPALTKAMQRLTWAAKIALEGSQPNVTLARLAMQAVLLDALQQYGVAIRSEYLKALAWAYFQAALATTVLAILLYTGTHGMVISTDLPPPVIVPGLTLTLLTLAIWCLCFGAWLSAAVRLEPDSAEVLDSIFRATFSAKLRAAYVLGFGFLALLLLHKQVIVFSFGANVPATDNGFTTAKVLGRLSTAVLAGALLGLGEATLPNAVVQRSANLIAALTPK